MSLGRYLALLCADCGEVHDDRRGRCPYCGSRTCADPRRPMEGLRAMGADGRDGAGSIADVLRRRRRGA
jgi:hypothetical protein